MFVVDRPVSHPGAGDRLADFPGFSGTIMQSTYYDYFGGNLPPNDPTPLRERYYRHLNENFNLYSRQTDGRLQLRIGLPGSFAIPRRRPDIKKFEIKKLEHVVVGQAADCDRPAFKSGATEHEQPTTAMSLYPEAADYAKFYCLKITLRGKRAWTSDRHPYRIFLIPQRITTAAPAVDGIWLSF